MPAISISFNRFLLLLFLQTAVVPAAWGQLPEFDQQQMSWLGDRILLMSAIEIFPVLQVGMKVKTFRHWVLAISSGTQPNNKSASKKRFPTF